MQHDSETQFNTEIADIFKLYTQVISQFMGLKANIFKLKIDMKGTTSFKL